MPLFLEDKSKNDDMNNLSSIVENSKNYSFKTYTTCKICHEKAIGCHYGVLACQRCKNFFRRNVHKFRDFICHFDQKCLSNWALAKKCKYCRWDLCIKAGMTIATSRKQNNNSNKIVVAKSSTEKLEINESYQSEFYIKPDQTIIFNTLNNQSFTLYKEHTKGYSILEANARLKISLGKKETYNLSNEFIEIARQQDLDFLKSHSNTLHQIIQELPGFGKFSTNDLKLIMNSHFYPIIGIMTIKLFINNDYYFVFNGGVQMSRQVFTALYGKDSCENSMKFYFSLKNLNLTEKELGILIPFFLSSIGNLNQIENKETMKEVFEYYCRALLYEFKCNKRSLEFMNNFKNVSSMALEINNRMMNTDINSDPNGK
ncbi:unnamed protein product [Brachionus calyciflorus]|uniref:Nuclear receptor domain-containing protein n=1 Tax=Brachionus calyciflorus TaxID=104777 RepID=A0A813M5P6_9BILA|nr:unnamed protein product [Brachionus calyciflorus]